MPRSRQEPGRRLDAKKPLFAGRAFMAVLLFLLWVPITVHCRLESIGMLPQYLACAEDCPTEGTVPNQRADGCCAVESASYRIDEGSSDRTLIRETEIAFWHEARAGDGLGCPARQAVARPPPPLIVAFWRFTCRAASLPRAPSLN